MISFAMEIYFSWDTLDVTFEFNQITIDFLIASPWQALIWIQNAERTIYFNNWGGDNKPNISSGKKSQPPF